MLKERIETEKFERKIAQAAQKEVSLLHLFSQPRGSKRTLSSSKSTFTGLKPS